MSINQRYYQNLSTMILAGINYPQHFAISGTNTDLSVAEVYLASRDIGYQRLPVNYAFHSANIEKAEPEFSWYCQTLLSFKAPLVPYMFGIKAEFLRTPTLNYFWHVVRYLLKFREKLHALEKDGANVCLDLGPQGTFANFVKRNIPARTQSTYAILIYFQQGVATINRIKAEVLDAK